jgi:hypothetical protein
MQYRVTPHFPMNKSAYYLTISKKAFKFTSVQSTNLIGNGNKSKSFLKSLS